ncbi:alpha/beta hydrolase family protein [Cryptosporangium sp. NPDC048952]|uniref:alpha/beta hydrolase family protein n=1 Tax=Cryptosporangium sp. NPDC048952 TaxID=3363961 RepID=UPI00371B2BA0
MIDVTKLLQRTVSGALVAAALVTTLGGAAIAAPHACPEPLTDTASCYSGQDADGAYYTIAVPKRWNRSLVVYAHGGPGFTATAEEPAADLAEWAVLVEKGYAWVASSYRRGGYGVRMAAADTENARKTFVETIGRPSRTYLHGQSWGGNVAAKAAEVYPRSWDGVLLTNGLLAGGSRGYDARVDLRAVYQYYCRNLPGPAWQGLPKDSTLTPDDVQAGLEACTGKAGKRTPAQQRNLDDILAVTRLPERTLDVHLQYATFLFQDIVWKRLGGRNPFSNQGVRYTGSHDDRALNAGIERFAADPTARRDLSYDSDLTGQARMPVLTLHAIGDPQVFVENESAYRAHRLVQTFTTETEHGGLATGEYVASIDALDAWVRTGRAPSPRSIAASCTGTCFYDPGYDPAPFATKVRPRPGGTTWPAMTAAQEHAWSRIDGVGIAP